MRSSSRSSCSHRSDGVARRATALGRSPTSSARAIGVPVAVTRRRQPAAPRSSRCEQVHRDPHGRSPSRGRVPGRARSGGAAARPRASVDVAVLRETAGRTATDGNHVVEPDRAGARRGVRMRRSAVGGEVRWNDLAPYGGSHRSGPYRKQGEADAVGARPGCERVPSRDGVLDGRRLRGRTNGTTSRRPMRRVRRPCRLAGRGMDRRAARATW